MNNDTLVKQMLLKGYLVSESIIETFKDVDRKDFVGKENKAQAYEDRPLPIGHGQTISQPSTVAFMLEKLSPQPGNRILDIGSGSGWTTALLGYLAQEKGRVIGIERIKELVKLGQKNIQKYSLFNISIEPAGKTPGLSEKGPYDRILVSAASERLPIDLLDQLKSGGRLVIPIKGAVQVILKEADGSINQESYPGFVFVPLV